MLPFKNALKKMLRYKPKTATILAYHRVATTEADPQLLCVSPENFEAQLKIISQHFNPVPLQSLKKKIEENSVVITFDDGYLDNLLFAKPLLEKYKIPATIFVTTGYINKNTWWDKLENLFSLQKESATFRDWNIERKPINDKTLQYLDLHKFLKPLSHKEKEIFFAQHKNIETTKNRIMNEEEILQISQSPYIEIGAHTVTHPQLSTQNYTEQSYEITESKKVLEKIIGKPIKSFSYPFGSLPDIGNNAPEIAKKSGYTLAVANFPNLVTKHTNDFLLPRYLVRNWNEEVFSKKIKNWTNHDIDSSRNIQPTQISKTNNRKHP